MALISKACDVRKRTTNTSAVDFEKQQAAQADQKEAQRQADLQSGISAINAIYDPQPVMKTTQPAHDY